MATWISPLYSGLSRSAQLRGTRASSWRRARCCSRSRAARSRCRRSCSPTASPAAAPTVQLRERGDLYSIVRSLSAACRCGSPVPPNQTSVFGFAFSAISWASASPEPLSDMLTLMPVALREHGLDHVAPVGLHRADHVDLARAASARPTVGREGQARRRTARRGSSSSSCLVSAAAVVECSLGRPGGPARHRILSAMSFDLVLFGGTGDLTWRKLMPALFQAWRHGKLPEGGRILAVSRQDLTDAPIAPGSRSASSRSKTPSGRATRSSIASPPCSTTCASISRSRATTRA